MTLTQVLSPEELLVPSVVETTNPILSRLLPLANWDVSNVPVAQMPIEAILVNHNGYGEMSDLEGLTASIKERGVLEPLIITPDRRLLAGHRRLEAARRAGLTMVPVRVFEIADERTAIEIGLVENVERADLDPLTRAKAYRGLMELGASVEEIARLVGQGTGHVYQHLGLLELHPEVQEAVHTRRLSFADARSFKPLTSEEQAALLQEIRRSPKPLSSRQVKARVDARRVIRLVQQVQVEREQTSEMESGEPSGKYNLLFEADERPNLTQTQSNPGNPLDDLNVLIGEMIAAAQGEDQVRTWARRLSHILERLQGESAAPMKVRDQQGRLDLYCSMMNRGNHSMAQGHGDERKQVQCQMTISPQ
jgi:ParB/RepB/Spo0J family partition protein